MRLFRTMEWKAIVTDLVVVIVGILIAVEIDEWNTDRQQRITADQHLQRLADDIEADSAMFEQNVTVVNRRIESVDRLLEWLASPSMPPSREELRATLNAIRGGGVTRHRPIRGATFTDMMNTGVLG